MSYALVSPPAAGAAVVADADAPPPHAVNDNAVTPANTNVNAFFIIIFLLFSPLGFLTFSLQEDYKLFRFKLNYKKWAMSYKK